MKKHRIMLISHEMTYTGAPNSLLNVARVLRENGHRVKVYSLNRGNFEVQFRKYGFRVRLIKRDLDAKQCRYIAKKFDLVICNTIFCGDLALTLQDSIKTILYLREAENLPDIMKNSRIDMSVMTEAENMISVSDYAASFIERTYRPKRLFVLNNFLMKSPLYRLAKNKVRGGKIHFLLAATVEKRKGTDVAIKAIKALPKHISQKVVLDIAGRKPEWSKSFWKDLIPKNDPRIVYHGEVTRKKNKLFRRANVVIVPSLDESCSLTALEGAMFGKPVITTENVGARYIADFVVKTGSHTELAKAMEFFVNNIGELETAGERAFQRFKDTSTKAVYYRNLENILSEVMDE